MYPTLNMTVLVEPGLRSGYPSLKFKFIRDVYSRPDHNDGITLPAPLDVIQIEKNEHINLAMQHIAGSLTYDPLGDKAFIVEQLRKVGTWIAERIVPKDCFNCCSNGLLPRTIFIRSDQDDIPWEITLVGKQFLSELAVHARSPFVASGRREPIQFASIPKILVIVGKANDLPNVQLEINEIDRVYQEKYRAGPVELLRNEAVTTSEVTNRLASGHSGAPYDLIHFVGHGSSDGDAVWLHLPASLFLLDDVPRKMRGNPIVFWNSCFSAASAMPRRYQPDVSSGFGNRLLSGGASHFIGTLLPIPDEIARMFAAKFYQNVFSNFPIGDALFQAKSDIGKQDALVHTYALYGNPHIRINCHG